jgi:hypothetical protein
MALDVECTLAPFCCLQTYDLQHICLFKDAFDWWIVSYILDSDWAKTGSAHLLTNPRPKRSKRLPVERNLSLG